MSSIDETFDAILARFEQMEAKMDAMNAKLDGNTIEMNERFAAVLKRLWNQPKSKSFWWTRV